jgi:DNA-binding transcriptional LysR family regulator
MLTFKQLEAVYWVVQLGGFSQAATKLHTTQSALSKRVHELEVLFGTPLFDRAQRKARLTDKGEEMLSIAKKLLEQRDVALDQFAEPGVVERRVRLGVTELTAMTWLPRWVDRIQALYPKIVIEPDVDMSASLRDKLLADEVDLIIVPDAFGDPRFSSKVVGKVESAWMCKPGTVDSRKTLRLDNMTGYRLLVQGDRSGTGLVYSRWLKSIGITLSTTMSSNNLMALIGLTASGLGLSYLPRKCLSPMIKAGVLRELKVRPALPPVTYVGMSRSEQRSSLISSLLELAQQSCDFTRAFQIDSHRSTAVT